MQGRYESTLENGKNGFGAKLFFRTPPLLVGYRSLPTGSILTGVVPTGTVPTSATLGHYSTIKDTSTCAHLNGCFICRLNTHL